MFPFAVEKWRPWLMRVQPAGTSDPCPLDRVLRWFQVESNGNVCSVGRVDNGHVYEAGLAQTYFETPTTSKYGVTSSQLRARCSGTTMPTNLTDDDRELQARVGLATVKDHRAKARAKLKTNGAMLAENSNEFWCWVKLVHASPAVYDFLPHAKRAIGRFPSWREFRGYVESLTYEERAAINQIVAQRADAQPAEGKRPWLDRVFDNCEAFAGGGDGGFASFELVLLLAIAGAAYLLANVL